MKHLKLIGLFILLAASVASAQHRPVKIELNGGYAKPIGKFAAIATNDPKSNYVQMGSLTEFSLKTYGKRGFGLGLKVGQYDFLRDEDRYAHSLLNLLETDNLEQYRLDASLLSLSTVQLGVCYQFHATERIFIEPYVYGGLDYLSFTDEEMDYLKNGVRHSFYRAENILSGFSVNAGLNLGYQSSKGIGLYIFASYNKSFLEELESSYTEVSTNDIKRYGETLTLQPENLSFGLGLSMSLGSFKKKSKSVPMHDKTKHEQLNKQSILHGR